jgi:hypothetical protein
VRRLLPALIQKHCIVTWRWRHRSEDNFIMDLREGVMLLTGFIWSRKIYHSSIVLHIICSAVKKFPGSV